MNVTEIKKELAELRKKIKYHSKKYYDDDAPEISDFEFDLLMNRLKEIEKNFPEFITKNSPTQIVGGNALRTAGKKNYSARCQNAFAARCFFKK